MTLSAGISSTAPLGERICERGSAWVQKNQETLMASYGLSVSRRNFSPVRLNDRKQCSRATGVHICSLPYFADALLPCCAEHTHTNAYLRNQPIPDHCIPQWCIKGQVVQQAQHAHQQDVIAHRHELGQLVHYFALCHFLLGCACMCACVCVCVCFCARVHAR
eukprot:1139938-Pelagomonas_calceolata.AAC.3